MSLGQTKSAATDVSRMLAGYSLSEAQMLAVSGYLNGKSKIEAARDAGYSETSGAAMFRSASVQAALAACIDRFMVGELAPQAIHTVSKLLADTATPAGVKATLALGVLDRAGFDAKRHQKQDGQAKDISAMSTDELQQQIAKIQREIDAKMRDITPDDAPNDAQDIDLFP